jgi:hypothetical protein
MTHDDEKTYVFPDKSYLVAVIVQSSYIQFSASKVKYKGKGLLSLVKIIFLF